VTPARRPASLLALLALAVALGAPAAARASAGQESLFQDDNLLIFSGPARASSTLDTLAGLGVDRIRVSLFWGAVAPGANHRARPDFDASDPAAYPPGSWARYDDLVRAAAARGIAVLFDITGPAPLWATGRSPDRSDIDDTYDPSAAEYGSFAAAAGARYTGSYVPPGESAPLPRVDAWAIWNEPNQPGWLTPQWLPARPHGFVEAAPRIYRALVDAGLPALQASGHAQDTLLIGELAPKGQIAARGETRAIRALTFLRSLYCVDRRLHVLRGARARAVGCPTSHQRHEFRAAHPALFEASAFAHHPYQLLQRPDQRSRNRDFVTIAELPRLERVLDRILRHYGVPRRLPLWLTEFGYQTRPPDPLGVSLGEQAAYLNQAEYIAYRDRRVRALSQFLLVDDRPVPGVARSDPRYWGTFQTGLLTLRGAFKPAFKAYRLPLWVPQATRRGRRFHLWGIARPAPNGGPATVAVQFARRSSWRTVRTVTTANPRGFLDFRVTLPGTGRVRLAWTSPSGLTYTSREVGVRIRRRR
jgi:hypothetical protein